MFVKCTSVMLIVCLLNILSGCSNDRLENPDQSNAHEQIYQESASAISGEEPGYATSEGIDGGIISAALPNGATLRIDTISEVADTIYAGCSYFTPPDYATNFSMKITPSFEKMLVYDNTKGILGGYEIMYDGGQYVVVHMWSQDDELSITTGRNDGNFVLGIESTAHEAVVEFTSEEEMLAIIELLNSESIDLENLTPRQQELVVRANAISDGIAEFESNLADEIEGVFYFLTNESHIVLMDDDFQQPIMPLMTAEEDICAGAQILAASCFFVSWCVFCWVVCVPATGYGLTCSVAELITD